MASASLRVETTFATFGAIAQKIGGDLVQVHVLASPKFDPHFIVPKPSLIFKLRRADLLILNGGGLELGWLPSLIRGANNSKIKKGAKGFLDISLYIPMIDVPSAISRGFGDVHSKGNPHYTTDPHMVLIIAQVIKKKLQELDPNNKNIYEKNLNTFTHKWQNYLNYFDGKMKECKEKKVVQYHELFNYFLKRYNYTNYANIEPHPGISPSMKHTVSIINTIIENDIKLIVIDVFHETKTTKFIAAKTGAKVVLIPHDMGAKGSDTLEEYYLNVMRQICQ